MWQSGRSARGPGRKKSHKSVPIRGLAQPVGSECPSSAQRPKAAKRGEPPMAKHSVDFSHITAGALALALAASVLAERRRGAYLRCPVQHRSHRRPNHRRRRRQGLQRRHHADRHLRGDLPLVPAEDRPARRDQQERHPSEQERPPDAGQVRLRRGVRWLPGWHGQL